jgi:hypothetical protein
VHGAALRPHFPDRTHFRVGGLEGYPLNARPATHRSPSSKPRAMGGMSFTAALGAPCLIGRAASSAVLELIARSEELTFEPDGFGCAPIAPLDVGHACTTLRAVVEGEVCSANGRLELASQREFAKRQGTTASAAKQKARGREGARKPNRIELAARLFHEGARCSGPEDRPGRTGVSPTS